MSQRVFSALASIRASEAAPCSFDSEHPTEINESALAVTVSNIGGEARASTPLNATRSSRRRGINVGVGQVGCYRRARGATRQYAT